METEPETLGEMMWTAVWIGDDMVVHPFGDAKSHELTSEACACEPVAETLLDKLARPVRMITHNAFDGRE